MVDEEQLKRFRAMGVKSIEIHGDGAHFVEFFPAPGGFAPLDLSDLDNSEGATDRPPPGDEDGPPNLPPAMQRILNRGSVS